MRHVFSRFRWLGQVVLATIALGGLAFAPASNASAVGGGREGGRGARGKEVFVRVGDRGVPPEATNTARCDPSSRRDRCWFTTTQPLSERTCSVCCR
jgi:hypothetical protein